MFEYAHVLTSSVDQNKPIDTQELYLSSAQCPHARTDINNLETLTQHNAVFTATYLCYSLHCNTALYIFFLEVEVVV